MDDRQNTVYAAVIDLTPYLPLRSAPNFRWATNTDDSLKLWLPNPVHSSLRGGVSVLFLESWWACGCLEPCATVEVMLCGFPGFVCVARPLTFSHCHRLRIWQTRMVLFEKITFIYFVCSCAGVCMYICVYMMYACMMYVYVYVCVRRSEGNFWELVLSFHKVGPEDPIHTPHQASRQAPLPSWPPLIILEAPSMECK